MIFTILPNVFGPDAELLNDSKYFPVMMYLGEEAWTAKKEGFTQAVQGKTLLVLILDATWFCAKKMIEHNPFLLELPRFSFYGDYSIFFGELSIDILFLLCYNKKKRRDFDVLSYAVRLGTSFGT